MRYKSYFKHKGMIDYDQTLYIRHGNNFAGVNYPANLVLKGFKEAKDGVWFLGSMYGDIYMVPEDNKFFNYSAIKTEIFDIPAYQTQINTALSLDLEPIRSSLLFKYLFSLKL